MYASTVHDKLSCTRCTLFTKLHDRRIHKVRVGVGVGPMEFQLYDTVADGDDSYKNFRKRFVEN